MKGNGKKCAELYTKRGARDGMDWGSNTGRKGIGFSSPSHPDRLRIHSPIKHVPGTLYLSVKWPNVKLTTHHPLVPSLRMRGAIPSLPQYVFKAWRLVMQGVDFPFTSHTVRQCTA